MSFLRGIGANHMGAINIIFNEETFKNLSTFNTVSELNEAVSLHIQHNKQSLNKNAVRILRHLKDYSKKHKGVSYQTKSHIAKNLGLSRRTVIRNCNLLGELGIIKQYEMKRNSDFMQTSNAIVIQPFTKEDSENVTPVSHQKETLFKKQNNNIKTTSPEIDHTYLPSFIDSSFIETTRSFFSAEDIYKLWLRVLIAYKKSGITKPLTEVVESVNKAFKETVFMYKQGRITTSFSGYFYRLMEAKLAYENRLECDRPKYNWLEA